MYLGNHLQLRRWINFILHISYHSSLKFCYVPFVCPWLGGYSWLWLRHRAVVVPARRPLRQPYARVDLRLLYIPQRGTKNSASILTQSHKIIKTENSKQMSSQPHCGLKVQHVGQGLQLQFSSFFFCLFLQFSSFFFCFFSRQFKVLLYRFLVRRLYFLQWWC